MKLCSAALRSSVNHESAVFTQPFDYDRMTFLVQLSSSSRCCVLG